MSSAGDKAYLVGRQRMMGTLARLLRIVKRRTLRGATSLVDVV